jgi:ElaB/YqjD/DUF883 family membrane-anchored ribosome-binding protein
MSDEPEVIRQQMAETRSALTEKLQTLEQQVVETVSDANTAVAGTVETVKDAVQDTVKDTFDVPLQVQRHPWAFVGGSVALGYLGGALLDQRNGGQRRDVPAPSRDYARTDNDLKGGAGTEAGGVTGWVSKEFSPEIAKLKALAIGALIGVARDAVVPSLSGEIRTRVEEIMNDLTTRMGGAVFHEPLLNREEKPRSRTTEQPGQEPDYLSTLGRPRGGGYRH